MTLLVMLLLLITQFVKPPVVLNLLLQASVLHSCTVCLLAQEIGMPFFAIISKFFLEKTIMSRCGSVDVV
jgi:hypothetical protein